MWDEYTPLQLLKTMPRKLNQDNLSKIQMVIDADKYKNSLVSGFDLCGIYAPFCRGCDKTSIYPCAIAYIRMMQSEGMNIEIDASPVLNGTSKNHIGKPEVSRPLSGQELQNPATAVREVKIAEHKTVKTRGVQEVRFSEPKIYKSKSKENLLGELAVTEAEDEPVLVLPEIKTASDLKPAEEIDGSDIFIPVKETVALVKEPVKEPVKETTEDRVKETSADKEESVVPVLPSAPVKEETPSAEPVKRRIRIAVARRKL